MTKMGAVGSFLEDEAHRRGQGNNGDAFGRSAYNRYYYAAFLTTRDLVKQIDPRQVGLTHTSYQEYLNKTVKYRISKELIVAKKVSDKSAIRAYSAAMTAVQQLSQLLRNGYALRVMADYHPEVPIGFKSSHNFTLNGFGIKEAGQWPDRAAQWADHINAAWKQINA